MVDFDPTKTDLAVATSSHPATNLGPMFQGFTGRDEHGDWIGEPSFLLAVLALLNSRNAAEIEFTEPASNKRRRLTGKPPLHTYRLVCIPSRYKQRYIPTADEDPRQIRAHFVRGHFKVRKTGVYFWSAFQRGNPALGFAHKDYLLAPSGAPTAPIKINSPWAPKPKPVMQL